MTDYRNFCPRCGSPNIEVQMATRTHYKEGHGCLYSILFGIFYWTWLIIKWMFKLLIAATWYVLAIVIVPIKWLMMSNSNRAISASDWTPDWLSKLMRRKGVVYTEYRSMWICHNCGNIWRTS